MTSLTPWIATWLTQSRDTRQRSGVSHNLWPWARLELNHFDRLERPHPPKTILALEARRQPIGNCSARSLYKGSVSQDEPYPLILLWAAIQPFGSPLGQIESPPRV